jgi:UDP-glucose 4-epimerase
MTKPVAKQEFSDWAGVRVLVTGAAGFIGSHLSERLANLCAQLTLVDDYSNASWLRNQWPVGLVISVARVCDATLTKMIEAFAPTVIFHLAGCAYAAGSVDDPERDIKGNLASTFELLEALKRIHFDGRLVYASSAAVYGEPYCIPITEDHPTLPISPYGVSKLAAERYVAVYSCLYGIPAVSVRLFSVYGPRQRKQVVYDIINKLQSSTSPVFLGDGTQKRDLVYVSDVIDALLLIARKGPTDGSVYNVCSGTGTTIRELVERISTILEVSTPIKFSGQTRGGDPQCWIGSPAKFHELGFRTDVTLLDGLERTVRWAARTNVKC